MSKQSSIEWYIEQRDILESVSIEEYWERKKIINEQAKAMHKEEMRDLYLSHVTKAERLREIFKKQFEEYYNETFGGNNE